MINQFKIEFDRNYGCYKRTGWSISINGSFYADLEKHVIVAFFKAFHRYWFVWNE